MAEVIKISDNLSLAKTSVYPYAKWEFEEFNQIQTRLLDIYDTDCNVAVASSTASGKTVSAELFMAHAIRKLGGKALYVGPLKSLAKEKEQDWKATGYHFSDLNISIATGDYRLTAKRIKELDECNIVVMTPEMLASRTRNHKSEKSNFLNEVKCIVFDESHLLTVPKRGDHIEVALMKLADINPDIKVVMLSATMPNVDEVCGWVSNITGRDTYYLESDYRPCPLGIHYETYYDGDKGYWDKELSKVATACQICEYYPNDKFLIFTHTIETGLTMVKHLSRRGIESEFHNGTKDAKTRFELENRFKNDKDFRVLVATSTLAWGVQVPARRVIIAGVHRGLMEVENYDIQQMCGRAGRPRYDPRGDAYILVPEENKDVWVKRLKQKPPIRSTLLDFVGKSENPHYKTLAFHIVAEVHQGNVKTKEGFEYWFSKSLAKFQDQTFDDAVVDKTIELLERCGAIYVENGEYQCSAVGKIASMFYYSPFDASELKRNFNSLFKENREADDFSVSIALGNIDSYRWAICNRFEKEAIAAYQGKIEKMFGKEKFTNGSIKHGAAIYYLMKGRRDISQIASLQGMLLADLDRTMQVLNSLDSMNCKWDKLPWFRNLSLRIRYGVEADLVELCQIPNIASVRAKRLKAKKIKNVDDFLSYDSSTLAAIMKCGQKIAEEALEAARLIKLKESIS